MRQVWLLMGAGVAVTLAGLAAPPAVGATSSGSVLAAPSVAAVKQPSAQQARIMRRVASKYSGAPVCGARISSVRMGTLRWGMVRSWSNPCRFGTVYVLVKRHHDQWRWYESLGSDWGAPGSCRGNRVPLRVVRDLTGYTCVNGTPQRLR